MAAGTTSPEGSQSPSNYFRRIHPLLIALSVLIILYANWIVFLPATIPYDCLGVLGTFSKYLVENYYKLLKTGYWLSVVSLLVEGLYAVKLCREKGITDVSTQLQWFVQTLLLGAPSLFYLLRYKRQKKRQ
ncbi:transmembrane protein 254 [Pogona vitticeps]|uniref:Transmembrane protein 254 n=1 Tax=Pogona vitticeps TaxID=103695 RepID=A0A6J0UJC9_9SAUR